ncbi:MAG: hypothetical protein KAR20_00860, partial [Candidatus Heimdallarchaeota archaeon]|nr:hypothetical protein [Candidatus Heimdallarchaeota archaeon]
MIIIRKTTVFLSLLLFISILSCASEINVSLPVIGTFKWVQTWGGLDDCTARVNAHDSKKNVYVAGYFKGTVDFNPSPDITDEYTSEGSNDCFLIKFNKLGEYQWVKVWGSTKEELIFDMFVDNRDNVILGGYFGDNTDATPGYTVDFNPSPSKTLELVGIGKRDCFISSFASNGTLRWATSWGGDGRDEVEAVTTDSKRNVYVTGIYQGVADFDPDPVNVNEYTAVGSNDLFLSNFDGNGNYESTLVWGGTNFEAAQTIQTDNDNNIYIGGIFRDTVDFDPDPVNINELTSNGIYDCWVSKFSSNLIYQWTKVWGGSGTDWVYSLTVDSKNDFYVSGYYSDTVDFDPDEFNFVNQTSNGSKDAFLSKFDENGIFIWVQTWGGEKGDKSGTVYLDGHDNIYVARIFGEGAVDPGYSVDFNPGLEIEERLNNGYQDCYFTKFDP